MYNIVCLYINSSGDKLFLFEKKLFFFFFLILILLCHKKFTFFVCFIFCCCCVEIFMSLCLTIHWVISLIYNLTSKPKNFFLNLFRFFFVVFSSFFSKFYLNFFCLHCISFRFEILKVNKLSCPPCQYTCLYWWVVVGSTHMLRHTFNAPSIAWQRNNIITTTTTTILLISSLVKVRV